MVRMIAKAVMVQNRLFVLPVMAVVVNEIAVHALIKMLSEAKG